MKVKDLLKALENADKGADVLVSVFFGNDEIDVDVEAATDLDYAVFIEAERLCIKPQFQAKGVGENE